MALAATTALLEVVPPFDFAQSLRFIGAFAPTNGEQALAQQSLTKGVRVAGRTLVFRVQRVGDTALDCTLYSVTPLQPTERQAALETVAAFLSLNDDLRPFYAIARDDALFAPVIDQLYGYHQVRFLTPFESACWAILTQRTPMAVARALKNKIIAAYGDHLEVAGLSYSVFPDAPTLAALGSATLYKLVGNERRAGYLAAAAEAFATVEPIFLRDASSAELLDWLSSIAGIGPWSASFILLRGLGRTDHLPLDEARLLEAAQRRYGHDRAPDRVGLAALAAPYGRWQGYWAHYLRVAA